MKKVTVCLLLVLLGCSGGGGSPTAPSAPAPTPTPTPTPCSPTQRTDEFAFTLAQGARSPVVVGPVRAGNGPMEVTLSFGGDYVILACVGTSASCIPMGGRPQARTFNIPGDFPAGPIQASVYFNPNFQQPPGDASGTVRFSYTQLCTN